MADVNAILDQIKGLTLLEAAELVKGIEAGVRRFGGCGCRSGRSGGGRGGCRSSSGGREDRILGDPDGDRRQ